MAAWASLHACGARLPWSRALEPAVRLAADGVPVARDLAATLAEDDGRWAADPGMADIFFPQGSALREGDTLRQPALSVTLRRVAAEGVGIFYGGEVGERFCRGLRERGGLLDLADLGAHETEVTTPLRQRCSGYEVLTTAPNSQGFVLLEVLAALERLGGWVDPLGAQADRLATLFALALRIGVCGWATHGLGSGRWMSFSVPPTPVIWRGRRGGRRVRRPPRRRARAATRSPWSQRTTRATPSPSSRASSTASARGCLSRRPA